MNWWWHLTFTCLDWHIADLLAENKRTARKLRNLGQRSHGKANQQYKRPLTKQKFAELTARVHKHTDADRFPIKPENRQFRKLWQDGSATLGVQDTEFVRAMGSAPKLITEIYWGWYDRLNGKWKTFETKIDYNMSVQEMYNIYGGSFVSQGSWLRERTRPPQFLSRLYWLSLQATDQMTPLPVLISSRVGQSQRSSKHFLTSAMFEVRQRRLCLR